MKKTNKIQKNNANKKPKRKTVDVSSVDIEGLQSKAFKLMKQGAEIMKNLDMYSSSMPKGIVESMRNQALELFDEATETKGSILRMIDSLYNDISKDYHALAFSEDFSSATFFNDDDDFDSYKNERYKDTSKSTEGQQVVSELIRRNITALTNGEEEVYDMVIEHIINTFEKENSHISKSLGRKRMKEDARAMLDTFVAEHIKKGALA